MSLIVARADQGRVIIFGDTKLTFKNSKNSNPYVDGCLKQYIVHDELAFGFAGIVEHFEFALPALLQCHSANEIAETAIKIKKQKGLDFDLIIGQAGDSMLTILKGEQIVRSNVGYIGDKDAFENYQKHLAGKSTITPVESERASIQIALQPEPLWDDRLYSRMFHAFKNTLHFSSNKTVGGIVVPLCTHHGKFKFLTYVDIISDPIDFATFSEKPIDFGTAEHGAFSVELADATPNGGSASDLGFYFLQGGFGLIFSENSNRLKVPKVILAENPAYWVLNSSYECSGGISSGYMTPDHCGTAAEQLLEKGNWKDAIFCYEQGKSAKDLHERPAVYDRFMAGYAVALFNDGKTQNALETLKKALSASPNSPLCAEYLIKLTAAASGKQLS